MKRYLFILGLLALWSCRKEETPMPAHVENGLVFNVPVLSESYQDGVLKQKITYFQKRLESIGNTVYYFFPPSAYAITVSGSLREVREYKYDENNRLLYEEYTRNDVPIYRRLYIYDKHTLVMMKTEAYPGYPYPAETRFDYSTPWEYSVSLVPVINGQPQVGPPDEYVKWKTPFTKELYDRNKMLLQREYFSPLVKAPDFNIRYIPNLQPICDRVSMSELFYNRELPPTDSDPGLLRVRVDYFNNGNLAARTTLENIKLNRHGLPTSYDEVRRDAAGNTIGTSKWSFVYTSL